MADRVFPLLNYVSNESTLSPRHRALLILRTAWLTQSASLWASHASHAADAGLDQDDVRRVRRAGARQAPGGGDPAGMSPHDLQYEHLG